MWILIVAAMVVVVFVVAYMVKSRIKAEEASKAWSNATAEEKAVVKVMIISSQLTKNNKFNFLNKNNATLFDTCLFILYIVTLKLSFGFSYEDKEKSLPVALWNIYFKNAFRAVMDIYGADEALTTSRINFYDGVRANSINSDDPFGINAVFNEYKNILSVDVASGALADYNDETPLYLLDSFADGMFLGMEAKYSLTTALDDFNDEIACLRRKILRGNYVGRY